VHRRAWVLIGVLAALWGASYMFIKVALDDGVTPVAVVFIRCALAALVLTPVAVHRGALRAVRGPVLIWITVLAFVQVVAPFLLITVGELHISSSLAAILVSSSPIFTALLALRYDAAERSQGWRAVGVVVGIAGVALLFGVDLTGDSDEVLGGVMILLASLGYAIGPLTSKHRIQPAGVQPVAIVTATMVVSSVVLLPVLPFTGMVESDGAFALDAVASLLVLGVGGTGLAFLIFYTLIADVGPARSSLVAYIAPGFSVVYGAAILDETISVGTIGGLALILLGSYLGAEGRLPWAGRPVEPVGELDLGDVEGGELPSLVASDGHERPGP